MAVRGPAPTSCCTGLVVSRKPENLQPLIPCPRPGGRRWEPVKAPPPNCFRSRFRWETAVTIHCSTLPLSTTAGCSRKCQAKGNHQGANLTAMMLEM